MARKLMFSTWTYSQFQTIHRSIVKNKRRLRNSLEFRSFFLRDLNCKSLLLLQVNDNYLVKIVMLITKQFLKCSVVYTIFSNTLDLKNKKITNTALSQTYSNVIKSRCTTQHRISQFINKYFHLKLCVCKVYQNQCLSY